MLPKPYLFTTILYTALKVKLSNRRLVGGDVIDKIEQSAEVATVGTFWIY